MLVRKDLGSLVIFSGVLLLILLLFRAVGAIRLRQTLACLHEKYTCSRQARDERQTFERLQLSVRMVRTPPQRWQAVCQAAEQLELAWVSLQVTNEDGSMETSIWRRADARGEGVPPLRPHAGRDPGGPVVPESGSVGGTPSRRKARMASPHFARVMTMSFPIGNVPGKMLAEFEIAILVNGSLRSANHRAGLFARLAEECVVSHAPVTARP